MTRALVIDDCGCRLDAAFGPGRLRKARAHFIPVMALRSFDFSNVVARSDIDVVLDPAVRALAYRRVLLSVRVHALTMSAGQSLQLLVWNALPSDEDPAQDFVAASPLTSATITSATSAPALVTSAVGYDPDACLKVSLRVIQAPTVLPLLATLSACLLMRIG